MYRIVPTRLIWAVFESLVSALCLMSAGCLPDGTPPTFQDGQTFERIMHMDIKDINSKRRGFPMETLANMY